MNVGLSVYDVGVAGVVNVVGEEEQPWYLVLLQRAVNVRGSFASVVLASGWRKRRLESIDRKKLQLMSGGVRSRFGFRIAGWGDDAAADNPCCTGRS